MARPLLGRRRKRPDQPVKRCMTPGCGAVLAARWKWLCDRCFGELPYARKHEICEARKAQAAERVFGLSRDAGEFIADRRINQAEAR